MITLKLLEDMRNCTRCGLRETCSQVVTGNGNLDSVLLIVGEAPGEDEDLEGIPFVGRSGMLLNKFLSAASINRDEIYIDNVIHCRPPGNRKPSQTEVNICKTWLWREILGLNNLKVIVSLGAVSTGLLLRQKNIAMGKAINKIFVLDYTSAILMPWYHPSYLLHHNNIILMQKTVDFFKSVKEKL